MRYIPYLSFNGNCREAFELYARVMGGEIKDMISYGETPAGEHVSPEWRDRIMNAYLVADGAELMGADTPPEMGPVTPSGFCISIQEDDEARAERIFNGLTEGGTIVMPLEPSFWARKFGMVTDRFGQPWMINCGMIEQEQAA